MSLKAQAYSGVRWSSFSFLFKAVLQLFHLAILARLLAPADFGLMAIVVAIMMFLQIFSDFGISNAIIHYQNITLTQLSSLYWLNVLVSIVLALLIAICSHWLAYFYDQPKLAPLLILAGLSLVISALGQQIKVLAQKKMQFKKLAKIDLFSALVGFFVSIIVAMSGGGVYALIMGGFSGAIVNTVLAWLFLADGWKPQFRLHIQEVRRFLKFGIYMIGNNLANTLNSQIDILLVGHFLSAQSVGLYNISKDLSLKVSSIINPIVTQVGFPLMAKAQGDKILLKEIYLKSIRMTASINFPVYVTLGLFAQEVLLLMLGGQWQEAVPLLKIFACWALVRSTANPVGSLVMACGRPDLEFKWNIFLLFFMPLLIWYGTRFDVRGLAFILLTIQIILFIPGWYFLIRPLCGAKLYEYSVQLAVPLALSLMGGGVAYFSESAINVDIPVVRLFVGLITCGLSYIFMSYFFNKIFWCTMFELFMVRSKWKNNNN